MTTKTMENTLLGFKYVQITIVLGGEGTASAVLDPERQQPCKKVLCLPGLYPFESICYQENRAILNPMTK